MRSRLSKLLFLLSVPGYQHIDKATDTPVLQFGYSPCLELYPTRWPRQSPDANPNHATQTLVDNLTFATSVTCKENATLVPEISVINSTPVTVLLQFGYSPCSELYPTSWPRQSPDANPNNATQCLVDNTTFATSVTCKENATLSN